MVLDTLLQSRGSSRITTASFERAALEIGCPVDVVRAVFSVEASGKGFRADGTLERRFEPHIWDRGGWTFPASLALGRDERDAMFRDAFEADAERAIEATSWGAPQIMGFHWRMLGFKSARAMVETMARSGGDQVQIFAAFVISEGLDGALRGEDWRAFALGYNGPARVDTYSRRIAREIKRLRGQSPWVILGPGSRGQAVADLQARLGVVADGVFGRVTGEAVREFQSENGLAVDGIVGANTWRALENGGGAPASARGDAKSALVEGVREHAVAVGSVVATVEGVQGVFDGLAREVFGWVVLVLAVGAIIAGLAYLVQEARR